MRFFYYPPHVYPPCFTCSLAQVVHLPLLSDPFLYIFGYSVLASRKSNPVISFRYLRLMYGCALPGRTYTGRRLLCLVHWWDRFEMVDRDWCLPYGNKCCFCRVEWAMWANMMCFWAAWRECAWLCCTAHVGVAAVPLRGLADVLLSYVHVRMCGC